MEVKFNTESKPPKNKLIDKLPLNQGLKLILESQYDAIYSLEAVLSDIQIVIEKIYKHLKKSETGRIIYVGAGTSGRIAVQDGVELLPTFGWPSERLNYLLAGGKKSLTKSIENAEDNERQAKIDVSKSCINSLDVVIALTASGNTPYTLAVANACKQAGSLVVGIGNNLNGKIQSVSDLPITLNTGWELVAGSTRLKAGTAQKVCLNLISTMIMTKFGRVNNGQMNFMVPTNMKLRQRKLNLTVEK